METRPEQFQKFLTPLLDAPKSRYVLRSLPQRAAWDPEEYVSKGLLPTLEEWKKQKEEHSPVLIIANLADGPSRGARVADVDPGKPLNSHRQIIDLVNSVRLKKDLQAYGPTRALVWLPDLAARNIIPQTVSYRGKLTAYVESAFHVEAVTAAALPQKQRREDFLDAESHQLVAKRMEEDGTQTPPERKVEEDTAVSLSAKSRAWHKELAELEEGFRSLKISQFVGEAPAPLSFKPGRTRDNRPTTPEYQKLITLRAVLKGQNKETNKLDKFLRKQEEIDALDLATHQDNIKHDDRERKLAALDRKIASFKNEIATLRPKELEQLFYLDDDRRAFYKNPPLLSWDRRRAEPLIVHPEEFYQPHELVLLDFQPLPPEQQLPLTAEQSLYFETICTNLFAARGVATLKHLNHVAPGAYDALVPKCPAITDPRKGGRRDSDSVRIRNLTPEMLWQLAIAWDEWLFKPDISDLLTHIGIDAKYWHQRTRSLSRPG